jgi:alpha-ketoglutarate-dependent taurine dioxygenase
MFGQCASDIQRFLEAADQALRKGWAIDQLECVGDNLEAFEAICRHWGKPLSARRQGEAIEVLIPTPEGSARPHSLSAKYGLGSFPAHSDCAHWVVPPRLLVLYCANNDEGRPTYLYKWTTVFNRIPEPSLLAREVFLFRTGRHSFYDSIVSSGRQFIRFDAGCMQPATNRADEALRYILQATNDVPDEIIAWSAGTALFLDNWHCLHGRGVAYSNAQRVFFRALFDESDSRESNLP